MKEYPFCLFAVRESVQESLGFSPFELVFGHSVRGPLKLMKEKLLSEEPTSFDLLNYVSDFKLKLSKACELAQKNLKSLKKKMKSRYDEKAFERNFKVGDRVLALLPIPGNPLQARYYGPYEVVKKTSDVNYIFKTPGRKKSQQVCHINMLKLYIDRQDSVKPVLHACSSALNSNEQCKTNELCEPSEPMLTEESTDYHQDKTDMFPTNTRLSNSDILDNLDSKLEHLDSEKQSELKKLNLDYKHLFPDVPSRTDKIFHDVDIGDAKPIKQHPYRLNPEKQKILHDEIKYLLDNDLIEPSKNEFSSPCKLVPKPDNSYRMCTDYRKVNNISKTDSFPIPRIDDCIDKVGNAKYVTKPDLLKGFWQIPLTERAKEVSAFVTPNGLFQNKVASPGENKICTVVIVMRHFHVCIDCLSY